MRPVLHNDKGIAVTQIAFRRFGAACAAALFAGAVQASPITFNFTFSGANLVTPPPVASTTGGKYPNAPKVAAGN